MNYSVPFDEIAYDYDRDFSNSVTGKIQKEKARELIIKNLIPEDKSILEINCGTGEDAIHFSGRGFDVLATDASPAMIEICEQKKSELNLKHLRFKGASFGELTKKINDKKFDVIISNFGGINCIDKAELGILSGDLYKLLNPGGKLFMNLMGRLCIWETLYFLYNFDLKKAFRRVKGKADCKFTNEKFDVFYYSPSFIRKKFEDEFHFHSLNPVGLFIPPTYLEGFFRRNLRSLNILSIAENKISRFGFLSYFSDHFLIVFKKRS